VVKSRWVRGVSTLKRASHLIPSCGKWEKRGMHGDELRNKSTAIHNSPLPRWDTVKRPGSDLALGRRDGAEK
jgi:hypothetical protein